jgi:hypothetical protein
MIAKDNSGIRIFFITESYRISGKKARIHFYNSWFLNEEIEAFRREKRGL